MRLIEAQKGQSALDIAVQYYGSVEGVVDLLRLNPSLIAVERNCEQGQKLWVGEPINTRVVNKIQELNTPPATAADVVIPGDWNEDFNDDFNI